MNLSGAGSVDHDPVAGDPDRRRLDLKDDGRRGATCQDIELQTQSLEWAMRACRAGEGSRDEKNAAHAIRSATQNRS